MAYMVIYGTPDGAQEMHEIDDLTEAVTFLEELRNERSVDSVRMLQVEEMSFDFRPYYRVELSSQNPAGTEAPQSFGTAPSTDAQASPLDESVDQAPSLAPPPVPAPDSPADVSPLSTGVFGSEASVDSADTPGEDLAWGSGLVTAGDGEGSDNDVDAEPQRRGLFGR